jgi:hypothetical protein
MCHPQAAGSQTQRRPKEANPVVVSMGRPLLRHPLLRHPLLRHPLLRHPLLRHLPLRHPLLGHRRYTTSTKLDPEEPIYGGSVSST